MLTGRLEWVIHLWSGSIVIVAVIGWLLTQIMYATATQVLVT
jgi:hypothetical protein